MPERFEVKMGNEATVAAMNTSVIASTDVRTGDLTEFSGSVTVTESGQYFFGIHATSDADNMSLRVDDVSIVENVADGIQIVKSGRATDHTVYSLDGRIVSTTPNGSLPKGIYIINGKKVVR